MEKPEYITLDQVIHNSHSVSDIKDIPQKQRDYLSLIGKNCVNQKGLYTVLTTLLYYKYLHPAQDVRRHQKQIKGGFSGRTFDTHYVTPVLKKEGLPAMAESGWLTRSLEQPYPYDYAYNGKMPAKLKMPFLDVLDYVEKNPQAALSMLMILLNAVIQESKKNQIHIVPLSNPDKLNISVIVMALEEHFMTKYGTHNGAKLPVIAFHSIYTVLVKEMKRYEGCVLDELSSLTACDRTNKASGDIEIFKDDTLYEAIEIKLDKQIDTQIVRVAVEKIYKWNPQRYYILSVDGVKEEDKGEINEILCDVETNHGCQIIINGLIATIRYYLRLITNLSDFVSTYSKVVEADQELQPVHKTKWNEIIERYKL